MKVDAFVIPGLEIPDALPGSFEKSDAAAPAYKIPPVIWIFVLGIGGYFILRRVLED